MYHAAGVLLILASLCSRSASDASVSAHNGTKDIRCPANCADIFKRLDRHDDQTTEAQIRGEPKSGTGTSEEWAAAALHATCDYLKRLYGDDSCSMSNNEFKFFAEMVFEPASSGSAACSCTNVRRVTLSVSGNAKHTLPAKGKLGGKCEYWHINRIQTGREGMCQFQDGRTLENQVDLWKCVQEAGCTTTDSRLQLVVMRDPRPMTVSAYFHRKRKNSTITSELTLDEYFQQNLEMMCQWVSLRYFFFTQILADNSKLFWYGDHQADAFDWHGRYLAFMGLNLPLDETMEMARAASDGEAESVLNYKAKGIDKHPGGREKASNSTFRDELGEDSLQMMDDVLRQWLPPVVLSRLGVSV